MILRLLSLSILMFAAGLITGWWLHHKLPIPAPLETVVNIPEGPLWRSPAEWHEFSPSAPVASIPEDLKDFQLKMEDLRFDDALVIYQQHERGNSPLQPKLRKAFLDTVEQWQKQGQQVNVIQALERFTEHYYQDLGLQQKLVEILREQKLLAKAIEVQVNSRSFASTEQDAKTLDSSIHDLSRELFKQQEQAQRLDETLALFQKLSMLEPDYAFYRLALAKSYLALGDLDNAIRELEILQIDPEFGRRAAELLAALFPPVPEEVDEQPVGLVPLMARGRHFMVDVALGQGDGARLLIDTGATLTTLPPETLETLRRQKLAVRVGHVDLKTANGFRFSPLYQVKRMQIGNFILRNLEVAELDLMERGGADGLLGMNVLGQFHFQINQDRGTLMLQPR